ncbi:MAG: ABZJ_00895 family protein [Acinetobacter sp.]
MKYYLLFFTAAYAVITIVFAVISTLLDLPNSSTGIATLFGSGGLTAWQFVKREQRIPTPEEKKTLIWGSIASTFLVSLILLLIFAILLNPPIPSLTDMLNPKVLWIWIFVIIVFGILILIEYLILHMSFGWYAKTCLKSLENKKRLN